MAAATTDKPAKKSAIEEVARVLDASENREMRASELLDKVGERALTIAWTGGFVEFGHREYTVTGNPDSPQTQSLSELHVESAENWSGPKKETHCSLALLLKRGIKLPECGAYRQNKAAEDGYVPVPDVSPLAKIKRADAEALVYLKARLTDKGHQLLNAE